MNATAGQQGTSPTRERMKALGLTPSALAHEAGVAVGSVENAFRRERAGKTLDRLGSAELKIQNALARLEAKEQTEKYVPETLAVPGADVVVAMLNSLPPESRRRIAEEIAEAYIEAKFGAPDIRQRRGE